MKLCVILIFLFHFSLATFGQNSVSDSLDFFDAEKEVQGRTSQKIDSVQAFFLHGTDSLRQLYHKRLERIDSVELRLQVGLSQINSTRSSLERFLNTNYLDSTNTRFKILADSLTLIKKYAARGSTILDSINSLREKTFVELNSKLQSSKEKASGKLNGLNLPSQLEEKVREVSSRISDFQMDASKFNIPDLTAINDFEIDGLKNLDLGSVKDIDMKHLNDLMNRGDLQNFSEVTGEIQEHVKALEDVTKGTVGGIETIENLAESRASELTGLEGIKNQTEELKELGVLTERIKNPDSLKEFAIEQAKEIAIDHFAGKEEQLTQAMQTLARYKSEYPSLNSISEIARKPPNEMKGKRLVERIVPGIALQVQKKGDDIMMDFNPYASYRFSGRISAGVGWNQRCAYNLDRDRFNTLARIFGPRIFGEFKLWGGFSPRVEMEIMNTTIPPFARSRSPDPLQREWLWGAFVGIKKEYRFIRNVNGTASVMMRLYNPHHKSPYADEVNARFGFELPYERKSRNIFRAKSTK